MHLYKLYSNQSWHKLPLFNLSKQQWIKHNATSLSAADCEAAPLYIDGESMKVDAGIVSDLTLPAHLLAHTVVRDMIITEWGMTEIRLFGFGLGFVLNRRRNTWNAH